MKNNLHLIFFALLLFIGVRQTKAQATLAFLSNDSTAVESSSIVTMYVKLTATSPASCAVSISVSALSNASASDYTLSTNQVTFAAGAPVNSTAGFTILINNDAIIESDEYVILRLYNGLNATIGSTNQCNFYIKDNDKIIPTASNALTLNLLSSFSNSITGANSAEIVAHDPGSQRLYIANSIGAKLDIVNFVNPSSPSLLASISLTAYGNINSVAVKNGTVAVAIENSANPQDSGKVVFFNKDGVYLNQVKVGMMPDMIVFNNAGTRVLTANEGEPNNTYTLDPDGSISIINISGGILALTQTNVAHVTFTVYNGQETTLNAQGIRIYGLGASASKDLEPEYITISNDDTRAYVTLQENNAYAEINLTNNSIVALRSFGSKNHSLLNNGFDASNQTKGINISNLPIKGLYLPDAIATYTVGGTPYIVTANEGDARAYTGYSEEARISAGSVTLDPTVFPNSSEIKNGYFTGRLNITRATGDNNNDGDLDTIFCYGSRSFSIWNAATGVQVYDSKDDLEQITSTNSFSVMFNASNSLGVPTRKDRSDDKGPEPEGVALGKIGSNTYAFIALERIGGVMVYDVTNPNTPTFVTYVNNCNPLTGTPDRGAEGIIFIPQSQSPNGQHIVIAANEISSSLSIWGIPGCASPIASSVSVSGNTTACSNNGPVLSVPSATGTTYQWYNLGTLIPGATSNSWTATSTGTFNVVITGPGSNCSASSLSRYIQLIPSPTLNIVASPSMICVGETATLTGSGANSTYSWNTGGTTSTIAVSPTINTTYTLTGTNTNSCSSSNTVSLIVSPCTNLDPTNTITEFVVYPNPTENEFVIQSDIKSLLSVEIISITGSVVYKNEKYKSGDKIGTNDLATGFYYVKIYDSKSNVVLKLIKD